MQAQPQNVAVNTQVEEGLVELDLQSLVHVGGGAPKGTWLTGQTVFVDVSAAEVEPAPKGTW
ncbi:hypothetical protein [Mitsuaria sp. 7]|uniref:hypothetical protein n=1 Tax=Mitsuaria sp. 7 TaxID=1658665 RepID=UPI0007DCD9ED|nr:hypothetical protein [Mitsuaria sp. 7]ANH69690.1 hypothetical protein ABE85_22715 [Mitsuaria sp. 7]